MQPIKIFFHSADEHFVRGLVLGTAILIKGRKGPSEAQRFKMSGKEPQVEFESERYSGNIRAAFVDSGHLSKLYDFYEVLTVKNWQKRGEKKPALAAESMKTRKGQQGILVTPFKLTQVKKPQTARTGQRRIEVRPSDNIVTASFSGFLRSGLDPKRLVIVAPSSVEHLIDSAARKPVPRKVPEHLSPRKPIFKQVHLGLAGKPVGHTTSIWHPIAGGGSGFHLRFKKVGQRQYVPVSRKHRPR